MAARAGRRTPRTAGTDAAAKRIPPALKLPFKIGLAYVASLLPGGLTSMMTLARYSPNPRVLGVVERWSTLPAADRKSAVIDDICFACEISPAEFIGEIARAAYSQSMDISKLMASIGQPLAVKAMTEQAASPDGVADRRMLFQTTGLLPSPQGHTFNVSADARTQLQTVIVPEGTLLPFEERMLRASRAAYAAPVVEAAPEAEEDVRS